jgi:SpoVK/Ycf46/Vps4 family AAA+-type ATPase
VATSNKVSQLPPELLRKGRFDEIYYVDLPSKDERKKLLKVHLEKRKRKAGGFDLDRIGEMMRGFSGSELEEVVVSGLEAVFEPLEAVS